MKTKFIEKAINVDSLDEMLESINDAIAEAESFGVNRDDIDICLSEHWMTLYYHRPMTPDEIALEDEKNKVSRKERIERLEKEINELKRLN